jgi:hypothetical protein
VPKNFDSVRTDLFRGTKPIGKIKHRTYLALMSFDSLKGISNSYRWKNGHANDATRFGWLIDLQLINATRNKNLPKKRNTTGSP